jgi:hypothetical protein
MAADVESSGEQVVSDIMMYDMRKILSAGGSNENIISSAQDMTQRVLCSKAAKNIPGANEQDARHVKAYVAVTKIVAS